MRYLTVNNIAKIANMRYVSSIVIGLKKSCYKVMREATEGVKLFSELGLGVAISHPRTEPATACLSTMGFLVSPGDNQTEDLKRGGKAWWQVIKVGSLPRRVAPALGTLVP
jgi:hypothetical protein